MRAGDLTTVARAKEWLGINNANSDALLDRLIHSNSAGMQTIMQRQIALATYTELRDGTGMGDGRRRLVVNNPPIYSVDSLSIDTRAIALSDDGAILKAGYAFDDNAVWVQHDAFGVGVKNIKIVYRGGFHVIDEPHVIPPNPYTVETIDLCVIDIGVKRASDGAAFTKVAATPITLQYTWLDGIYTFAAVDEATAVLISYGNIPADLEQACIEATSLRMKERDRIGVNSKSIGGESIAFTQKGYTDSIQQVIDQYTRAYFIA